MIELIRNLGELSALSAEWNVIADRFESPLLRYEWFCAAAHAFCPPAELCVPAVYSGGQVMAIAPLSLRRGAVRETLEILGASSLYEPAGLLYRDHASLQELVGGIRDLNRPVLFSRLPADSDEVTALSTISRSRTVFSFRNAPGSPFIPITGSWDHFVGAMGARRRYDVNRAQRRAREFGPVEFEVVVPCPGELAAFMREVMEVEAAGWKGQAGTAMLRDERMRAFFVRYAEFACALGMLRFSFLRINGESAAFVLFVEHANRAWVLKTGYDERWARCSPGILAMHDTIAHAFQRGLHAFEFLGTDEPWLHTWTELTRPYVSGRFYPISLRTLMDMGADVSRSMLRRVAADRGIS